MAKKKELAFRKKKKNRASLIIAIVVVVLFCGYFYVRGISLQKEKISLENDIATLNEQIASEEARKEELAEFETYTHTKKYAEEVAKNILGYVYEDEIIFKPED